jgi:hypothetical protein
MDRDKQRLARGLARSAGVDLRADFHALPSDQVESLVRVADCVSYRRPRNANGSRARSFFAYLNRGV